MKIKSRSNNPLAKRARKGFRGFPVATVAFYGPDDQRASKLVIGIISHEGAEPKLRRWYSDTSDLRSVPGIESEIKAFIKDHDVVSVSMVDRVIGCPHEEGIDYPDGESCPQCPFWRSRDRLTGEMIREVEMFIRQVSIKSALFNHGQRVFDERGVRCKPQH